MQADSCRRRALCSSPAARSPRLSQQYQQQSAGFECQWIYLVTYHSRVLGYADCAHIFAAVTGVCLGGGLLYSQGCTRVQGLCEENLRLYDLLGRFDQGIYFMQHVTNLHRK